MHALHTCFACGCIPALHESPPHGWGHNKVWRVCIAWVASHALHCMRCIAWVALHRLPPRQAGAWVALRESCGGAAHAWRRACITEMQGDVGCIAWIASSWGRIVTMPEVGLAPRRHVLLIRPYHSYHINISYHVLIPVLIVLIMVQASIICNHRFVFDQIKQRLGCACT